MFGAMLERLLEDGTLSSEDAGEKISVMAELRAKPGHEEEVRVILHSLVEPSRAHPGCLAYHLLEDKREPGSFSTYEEWTGIGALEEHLAAPAARQALAAAQPMIEGEMKLKVLRLLI